MEYTAGVNTAETSCFMSRGTQTGPSTSLTLMQSLNSNCQDFLHCLNHLRESNNNINGTLKSTVHKIHIFYHGVYLLFNFCNVCQALKVTFLCFLITFWYTVTMVYPLIKHGQCLIRANGSVWCHREQKSLMWASQTASTEATPTWCSNLLLFRNSQWKGEGGKTDWVGSSSLSILEKECFEL